MSGWRSPDGRPYVALAVPRALAQCCVPEVALHNADSGACAGSRAGNEQKVQMKATTAQRPSQVTTIVSRWLFYVVLIAGTAWRISLVFTPVFSPDSDRAVVYLMARHAAQGDFSALYWGQSYGGTALPITAGLVMHITGMNIETLAIVGIGYWAAAAWFTRAVAREMISPVAGDIAGVLVWLPAMGVVLQSILDPGFYGPTLAFALSAVWLIVRGERQKPLWQWALIGVLAGLAFWQSAVGGALVAPFLVWQALGQRRWRSWGVGAVAIVVGCAPWIKAAVLEGVGVFAPHGRQLPLRSAYTLYTHVLPASFHASPAGSDVFRLGVAGLAFALMASFTAVAIAQRRWPRVLFVVSLALVTVALVVGSGTVLLWDSYRYASFLFPTLAIAGAWLLTSWRPGIPFGIVFAVGAAVAFSVPTVSASRPGLGSLQAERWGADTLAVGDFLRDRHANTAMGDYWFAYRFTASQNESIRVGSLVLDRFPPYSQAAKSARPGFVVVQAGGANDKLIAAINPPGATRTVIVDWAVYELPDGYSSLGSPAWALF